MLSHRPPNPHIHLRAIWISSTDVVLVHLPAIDSGIGTKRVFTDSYTLIRDHTTIADTFALLDFNVLTPSILLLPTPASKLGGRADELLLYLAMLARDLPLPPTMRFSCDCLKYLFL